MRISVRAPFDADWMVGFLAKRVIPELESVRDATYFRCVEGSERPLSVKVTNRALSLSIRHRKSVLRSPVAWAIAPAPKPLPANNRKL